MTHLTKTEIFFHHATVVTKKAIRNTINKLGEQLERVPGAARVAEFNIKLKNAYKVLPPRIKKVLNIAPFLIMFGIRGIKNPFTEFWPYFTLYISKKLTAKLFFETSESIIDAERKREGPLSYIINHQFIPAAKALQNLIQEEEGLKPRTLSPDENEMQRLGAYTAFRIWGWREGFKDISAFKKVIEDYGIDISETAPVSNSYQKALQLHAVNEEEIPEEFLDPTTNEIMKFPTFDLMHPNGLRHDRQTILHLYAKNQLNPFTQTMIEIVNLREDTNLKSRIDKFMQPYLQPLAPKPAVLKYSMA